MAHMLEPSPELIEGIVQKLKTNGMFDEMRRDCLADIDTKPAFQNLKQRVENFVNTLLSGQTWTPLLNKNQLRSKVRTSVMQSGMLTTGVEHILHQVVDAKMYTEFLPKISDFINDNNETLRKEFLPEPEMQPEENVAKQEQEKEEVEEEFNSPTPVDHPEVESQGDADPPDTKQEKASNEEDNEKIKSFNEQPSIEEKQNDSAVIHQVPVIPEGAANTLRALIQSLASSSDIKSLITADKNDEETATAAESKKHLRKASPSGNSPSIDPSQIEAFTDDDDDEENPDHEDEGHAIGKVGPRTPEGPEEDAVYHTPPSHSEASGSGGVVESASSSDSDGDNDRIEQLNDSDISVHSEADTDLHQTDVVVADNTVDEGNSSEHVVDFEDEDPIHAEEDDETIEEENDTGKEQIETIQESLVATLDEMEVVEYESNTALYEEGYVVLDGQTQNVEAEIGGEEVAPDEEPAPSESRRSHSRSERKRRRKRHRRRRHSSSAESSDASGHFSASSGERHSSDGGHSEDLEPVRSRSRKKKKKKRSKKHKKSKVRDSSLDRGAPWDSPPDYRRSSISPSHQGQRRSFIPSPQRPPMRFEDDNRAVKVEPAFMPQITHFRDPYAAELRDIDGPPPPMPNIDRPFPPRMHHEDPRMGFPPRPSYPPRSPPHFPPRHRFSPPHFPSHSRYSPPYHRGPPFPMRPISPPPRRYSPNFDFYRPGFEPPRSPPPHSRRFSPPRPIGRFPGPGGPPPPFPGPMNDRFMPRSGPPRGASGAMMRPDLPQGGPHMDMRRPPMR
ncbi:uncharacterized protein LOC143459542 isoform X1 [Clavelina lepadiformis]|uniref:uncharacterized protein LOC143459542 isoform X1 n=1 Tax=Clavelina lepadiformis TaxID=159417 RepID=UPI004041DC4A